MLQWLFKFYEFTELNDSSASVLFAITEVHFGIISFIDASRWHHAHQYAWRSLLKVRAAHRGQQLKVKAICQGHCILRDITHAPWALVLHSTLLKKAHTLQSNYFFAPVRRKVQWWFSIVFPLTSLYCVTWIWIYHCCHNSNKERAAVMGGFVSRGPLSSIYLVERNVCIPIVYLVCSTDSRELYFSC